MGFQLDNVVPTPLHDWEFDLDSIWKNKTSFKAATRNILASPSGKGKSTLVSLLFGLRSDYSGTITFMGKDLKKLKPDEWSALRRETLSFIHQELKLFGQLSVWENFEIKNQLTWFKTSGEIKEMCEKLGVDMLLHRKCDTLSLGQQQRVCIIRALLQPFDYLLMDEPFSHLDAANTRKAIDLIESECGARQAGYILTSLGDTYGIKDVTYHSV